MQFYDPILWNCNENKTKREKSLNRLIFHLQAPIQIQTTKFDEKTTNWNEINGKIGSKQTNKKTSTAAKHKNHIHTQKKNH